MWTILDSENARRGLTAEQAAIKLLTADGHGYEIVPDGIGHRLLLSDSAGRFNPSVFFSLCLDHQEAEAEIFDAVLRSDVGWHGLEAMTDEAFAEMVAAQEAE